MTDYFPRDIGVQIIDALKNMPVVVITGMRQTGKSTFLQNQSGIKKRRYFTLDDFAHFQAAKEDPDGFIDTDIPLTIDEAQKCPELLTAIKKMWTGDGDQDTFFFPARLIFNAERRL